MILKKDFRNHVKCFHIMQKSTGFIVSKKKKSRNSAIMLNIVIKLQFPFLVPDSL